MVRREGRRFGVTTSHNVRRLSVSYRHIQAQQSIVIETKIDTEGRHAKKQAKTAVTKQMQRGAFNIQDETSHPLRFSLNKAKRWEVIEDIKENDHHDNHDIVTEHHMLSGSRFQNSASRTCVGVFDSSAEKVKRLPKKKYAKVIDLMNQQDEDAVKEEDEDFGKKNRKRSRKRRVHQEQEDCVPASTVWYDVTLAAPRQTYQTYCNTTGSADGGKKNRNSRNRTKKLHQCNMQDVFCDGLWELDQEDEEEYWQEETKDSDPYQRCMVSMETLINKAKNEVNVYDEDLNTSPTHRQAGHTKDRVYLMDEADAVAYYNELQELDDISCLIKQQEEYKEKKKKAKLERRAERKAKKAEERIEKGIDAPFPVSNCEKPSGVVAVRSDDITSDGLIEKFGNSYINGSCMPRRFALNITDNVIDQLKSRSSNHELATTLQQTGHRIFTVIDCMLDPWLTMREDNSLIEDIRVKVCGVTEGQEMLTNAFTGMDTHDFTDVVRVISQSVAALPLDSYLIDTSVFGISVKPALAVETIQSTLGWHYDVTNVNKATDKTLCNKGAKNSETGALIPSAASNACESCSICYEELDEKCPGTALISCSHWFCDECWKNHLKARIEQGDTNITCPGFKCTTAVDKVTLMSLVPSKYYSRHHGNLTNTALMLQPDLHWCPSPYCGRLLKLANQKTDMRAGEVVPVNCECGMFWCSQCKEEAHWPATCHQAKAYRKEAKDLLMIREAEKVTVNTKRCPSCAYPIEKSYGCNHMMCKCGYEFCWLCGKAFTYNHYTCFRIDTWRYQVHVLHPQVVIEKSAVELAVLHHRERTRAACHRRSRKARKLASRMTYSQGPTALNDSDDIASLSSSTSSISMVTRDEGPPSELREARKILSDVANFLSEGEFVLEHLEILLSSAPHSNQKRVLSQHKTRLLFITEHLHKILNEEVKLDMGRVQHLFHCGKSCLRWIAMAATYMASKISSAVTEE